MRRNGARARSLRGGVMLAGALVVSGCDGLFDAEDPGAIAPEELDNPVMLDALVVGMESAFNAAVDDVFMIGGLLSDEFIASGTWPSWHLASKEGFIDLNAGAGNIPDQMWPSLSEARFMAAEVGRRMRDVVPGAESDRRTALADLYLGLTRFYIGDVMCVGTYDGGPALSPAESFDLAEDALTSAITVAQAAGDDDIRNMAYLARARTRMQLGNWAGAMTDAATVPDGFEWHAQFDLGQGLTIGLWGQTRDRNEATVDVRFRETGDPRVPVVEAEGLLGADRSTPVWHQEKYVERDNPLPVGRWQEARLIEAEGWVEGPDQDLDEAVALINQVRFAAGLDPEDAATEAEARELLRNERAHELFFEGLRYGDMRRWNMFPADWGSACVPLNRDELDGNPNLQGS